MRPAAPAFPARPREAEASPNRRVPQVPKSTFVSAVQSDVASSPSCAFLTHWVLFVLIHASPAADRTNHLALASGGCLFKPNYPLTTAHAGLRTTACVLFDWMAVRVGCAQSSEDVLPRNGFAPARRFLRSIRRSREAAVGRVGRRDFGRTAACRIISNRRWR